MRYTANSVLVDARRIVAVGEHFTDGRGQRLDLEGGERRYATNEQLARITPVPGDYVVTQEDGYVYLNPKAVFERKYSPVTAPPAAAAASAPRVDFTRATELTPEVYAAVEDAFEYHKWTHEQIEAGKRIRYLLVQAVAQVILDVPAGPDRTTAIRKLREARMDANSAITHGGKY